MQFNGQKFSGISEKLSLNPRFILLKMQKYAFLKKNVFFIEGLYQILVQMVIDWSSRLQKTSNAWQIRGKLGALLTNYTPLLMYESARI